MGGKESKGRLPSLADLRESGMSREDLAAYLTSVSDMVETGHKRNTVPEIRVNNQPLQPPSTSGEGSAKKSARNQLRHKLEKQLSGDKPAADHVTKQLELLDGLEDSQDDSQDWAHMRDWLLYHMHENLDDSDGDDDITASASALHNHHPHHSSSSHGARRGPLNRQMSMDRGRITQRLRLQHQGSSTSSSGGRTNSYQNSFDSTGTSGGDT